MVNLTPSSHFGKLTMYCISNSWCQNVLPDILRHPDLFKRYLKRKYSTLIDDVDMACTWSLTLP